MNRQFLYFLRALALVAAAGDAGAATRVWPAFFGVGCTGTLQACIDASAAGDTVVIGADDVFFPDTYTLIDESLTITRAITLRAGDSIDAVFVAGRGIVVQSPASGAFGVTLEGLQLRGGRIALRHDTSGVAVYTLDRVRLRDGGSASCAVGLSGSGTGTPRLVVRDSDFRFDERRDDFNMAICANRDIGTWQVELLRNRITAGAGALFGGIAVAGTAGGTVVIDANRIDGSNLVRGIDVSQNPGSAANDLFVRNNAVSGQASTATGEYAMNLQLTATNARIVNNTVAYNTRGLSVSSLGTANIARLANNLVAFNTALGLRISSDITLSTNANNLVFQNGSNAFVPGPGTSLDDPRLRGRHDLHPARTSPARNAGSNADAPVSGVGPTFDLDGELRNVGAAVDIGAYEGNDDLAAVQIADASNTSGNVTAITALDGLGDEALQLTALASGATTAEAQANLGVFRYTPAADYAIFREDLGALSSARRYAVLAPLDGRTSFVHTSAPGNLFDAYTILDHPQLNGHADAIAFVTHNWNPAGTGIYHDHRIGLSYDGARWSIGNQDTAEMMSGRGFNVALAPAGSPNAFTADVGASPRFTLRLAHRLLDDNPCAAVFVTRNNGNSATNDVAYVTRYQRGSDGVPGRWSIDAVGGSGFVANTAFNVMVQGAQANACRDDLIFADGFERE